uniref:Uncharacterized protein n=1 Tax=Strongyloides venezuelensis TaxID=75913 RepID=A0A0K0FV73_STRVS
MTGMIFPNEVSLKCLSMKCPSSKDFSKLSKPMQTASDKAIADYNEYLLPTQYQKANIQLSLIPYLLIFWSIC